MLIRKMLLLVLGFISLTFLQAQEESLVKKSVENFNVSFKGGTLQELFTQLRAEPKNQINFVATQSALEVYIPAFELEKVSTFELEQVITLLSNATIRIDATSNIFMVKNSPLKKGEEGLFDLEFKGGTLEELLQEIKKKTIVNVILAKGASTFILPEFTLKSVRVVDVLSTIDFLAAGRLKLTVNSNVISIITTPDINTYGEKQQCRLFHLELLLGKYKIEDIVTAIDTAWGMLEKTENPPQLKFHQETQLLIAVATNKELRVIDEVVSELSRQEAQKDEFTKYLEGK